MDKTLSPVSVVFCVSDAYTHLLAVCLSSLAVNSNKNREYDVVILKKGGCYV